MASRAEVECAISRDLIDALESKMQARLGNRVRCLQLVAGEGGLILRGHTNTYYAKQIAQVTFQKITDMPLAANEINVI